MSHRRGYSTGSMKSKERDEDLALFHDMKAKECINFLHPSIDDIDDSLRYRIVATAAPPAKANDLLGLEPDKNDYDWLLTPPGTPLFPSLDRDAPVEEAAAVRANTRQRPNRTSRGSASPRRPSSPSSSTPTLTRRASFGNSSPSRSNSRPSTPTRRASTPGRTLSNSASFNSRTSPSPSSALNNHPRRTARSSSPSRKPRTANIVHPAISAGFSCEPPPNLRTSISDRPTSNTRGASLSPRVSGSTFRTSDPGSIRRAVSPSFSRSYSSSSSKGSVISSQNSGVEVNRPSRSTDVSGKRPSSVQSDETSPVKPLAKKPLRMTASGSFPAPGSQRKPFDSSARQMEFRRSTTSGFRPLMSNSHISSFYTRATSSLHNQHHHLNRPMEHHLNCSMTPTESSINSSSVASVHESEQEDEVVSKRKEEEVKDICMVNLISEKEDEDDQEMHTAPATPCSTSDAQIFDRYDTCSTPNEDIEDMQIDNECETSTSPHVDETVKSLLELVISKVVDLAEEMATHKQDITQIFEGHSPERFEEHSPSERIEEHSSQDEEFQQVHEEQDEKFKQVHGEFKQVNEEVHEESKQDHEEFKQVHQEFKQVQVEQKSEPSIEHIQLERDISDSEQRPTQETVDMETSSACFEVYQFDQELQTTGSEVSQQQTTPGARPSEPLTHRNHSQALTSHSQSLTGRGSKPSFSSSSSFGKQRKSRESSLFSIQFTSSKVSTTDNSSYDTKSSEYDTKYYIKSDKSDEDSCVDYYIDTESKRFDHQEDFVDYFIDDFDSRGDLKTQEVTLTSDAQAIEEERTVFVDETASMETEYVTDIPEESTVDIPEEDEEIDTMTECWKQLQEAEEQDGDNKPVSRQLSRSRSHHSDCGDKSETTRDNIILCSSIVHDIVYRAATLGIEKEDLKALATPASREELVTFLGISTKIPEQDARWRSEESTVRRTLAYVQSQKNTTVAYVEQSTVGRVEEDMKDHISSDRHRSTKKSKEAKCRCTIL